MLIGSEISRRGLGELAKQWLEYFGFPFATTLLSKSALSEDHSLFVGTYDSDLAPKLVRTSMEDSDCLITLGCTFGIDHKFLVRKQYDNMIDVSYGKARIGKKTFDGIALIDFLNASLTGSDSNKSLKFAPEAQTRQFEIRRAHLGAVISNECTHDTIFAAINHFLKDSGSTYVVASDTCLGSYPAADLKMPAENMFLANPVWLSIGQGTPAGVGAFFATGKRPLIVSGDGGFQMLATTYATMVRYRVPAIIIVIDNALYSIEQFLLNGKYFLEPGLPPIPFVELHQWDYHNFPRVFGGGNGARVKTVEELQEVLKQANNESKMPTIIAVEVDKKDLPAENLQYLRDHP